MIEKTNNDSFDAHVIKIIDLEEELEEKAEACDELENTCKEKVMHHQQKHNALKKKLAQNGESLRKMKVKKVHFSLQRVNSKK